MADVPYAQWFSFARRFFPPGKAYRVAELMSGPGRLAALAREAGYTALCLDISLPALRSGTGERVAADVMQLPIADAAFAVLINVNGSVNYLPDTGALGRYFGECRRVLSAGGSMIMDFCPAGRALELHGRRFTALSGRVTFAHRYNADDAELLTVVNIRQDGQAEISEIHRQHIFAWHEIRGCALAAGFASAAREENFGLPYSSLTPMVTCAFVKRT